MNSNSIKWLNILKYASIRFKKNSNKKRLLFYIFLLKKYLFTDLQKYLALRYLRIYGEW